LAVFVVLLALITKPMGLYLMPVLDAKGKTWLDPVLKPLERLTYWFMGVDPAKEQDWKQYTFAMLLFSLVSCLFTYAILRLQNFCRSIRRALARSARPGVQHRRQLHHQHQLAELQRRIHHVLSLADGGAGDSQFRLGGHGIAIAAALVRGIARHSAKTARQFLGGSGARHLLFAAADLRGFCRRSWFRRA
jgi:potassium-transporting ATPase potassium-binding subunit